MKELVAMIFKLDIKGLLFRKTDNRTVAFFRYLFVGGISFVVDYTFFAIVSLLLDTTGLVIMGSPKINSAAAVTIGFIAGLIINFFLAKKFVFAEPAAVKSRGGEFFVYAIIGVVGWGMNILLVWLFEIYISKYIAKLIVSAIVLIYNYLARRLLLYRK